MGLQYLPRYLQWTCFAIALSPAVWGDCKAGLAAAAKSDYAAALREFTASAGQGDACSQYNLGVMYDQGHGVQQNFSESFKWYSLAAKQGYAEAQRNLGLMYEDAQGVP